MALNYSFCKHDHFCKYNTGNKHSLFLLSSATSYAPAARGGARIKPLTLGWRGECSTTVLLPFTYKQSERLLILYSFPYFVKFYIIIKIDHVLTISLLEYGLLSFVTGIERKRLCLVSKWLQDEIVTVVADEKDNVTLATEPLLNGKAQYGGPPCTN
jgi:hypothetical protein